MNEQAINQIKEALREMMQLLVQRGQPISEEIRIALTQAMEHAANRIQELRQEEQQPFEGNTGQQQPSPQGIGAPPGADAQLLFLLAGSREDVFIQYLQQYQTPETQALLNNPAELERVVHFLHAMMPSYQPEQVGDVQRTELNSSTIFGTNYDANSGKMKVRFQGGGEYIYSGVPANIYRAFIDGQHSATTNGQNAFGRWWEGKNPSIGSAFNAYIKKGNFPFQKIS